MLVWALRSKNCHCGCYKCNFTKQNREYLGKQNGSFTDFIILRKIGRNHSTNRSTFSCRGISFIAERHLVRNRKREIFDIFTDVPFFPLIYNFETLGHCLEHCVVHDSAGQVEFIQDWGRLSSWFEFRKLTHSK